MGKFLENLRLLVVLLLLGVLLGPVTPVKAATTAEVTVNATPAFVSITNSPSVYAFGAVAVNSSTSTTQGYFTIANSSSVNIDVSIATNSTTWTGGVVWTHSDSGVPAADTAALFSSPNTNNFGIAVKNASPGNIATNEAGNVQWELRLLSPTVYSDGIRKNIMVVLTATAS